MKTKRFKFEQKVTTIVEMKYIYKVEAKTAEDAEAKFNEAFAKKLKKGTESSPVKKFLSKYEVIDSVLASPELMQKSTLTIEFIADKKSKLSDKLLFDNRERSEIFYQQENEENTEVDKEEE
jgi:hypothetical protein